MFIMYRQKLATRSSSRYNADLAVTRFFTGNSFLPQSTLQQGKQTILTRTQFTTMATGGGRVHVKRQVRT